MAIKSSGLNRHRLIRPKQTLGETMQFGAMEDNPANMPEYRSIKDFFEYFLIVGLQEQLVSQRFEATSRKDQVMHKESGFRGDTRAFLTALVSTQFSE